MTSVGQKRMQVFYQGHHLNKTRHMKARGSRANSFLVFECLETLMKRLMLYQI